VNPKRPAARLLALLATAFALAALAAQDDLAHSPDPGVEDAAAQGPGEVPGAPGSETAEPPAPAPPETGPPAQVGWGYAGETGPEHWASLGPQYAACGSGQGQSPVDIRRYYRLRVERDPYSRLPRIMPAPRLHFVYYPAPLTLEHGDHTVRMAYDSGSYMRVDREKYDLSSVTFHTPSEHRIGGYTYPAEIHLAHDRNNERAVVAVFVEEGPYNPNLQTLINNLPREPGARTDLFPLRFNASDLLPHSKRYYRYRGSLTTPPCSEGVQWYVLTTPIHATAAQIERLREVLGENARPVQPLGDRRVIRSP
jgi:carbonic anhydrase